MLRNLTSLMTPFLALLILLPACDSPMNHRVQMKAGGSQKLQTMRLDQFQLSVEVQWLMGPFGGGTRDCHLLVILKNAQGVPTSLPENLSLNFYSMMPSMGHPMDRAGYFEKINEGIYVNHSIRFSMAGDWRHELQVMDSNYQLMDRVVWDEFF